METLAAVAQRAATESGFSGVVRIERDGTAWEGAYGLGERRLGIAVQPDTQLAIASGTKGLTAVAIMALVEDGALALDTPARLFLGRDLPSVGEGVTIELLLAHRSGIGDYLDEDDGLDLNAYLMPVPVQNLASTPDYLDVLGGHPPKFVPDADFSYCNAGYVVLALIAERVTDRPFAEIVRERVCVPAGMADTAFFRSDELPRRAALGYVLSDGRWRNNVFHLPVLGSGDGGLYSTACDVHHFWRAFMDGRLVQRDHVDLMLRRRSQLAEAPDIGYGMGFWLAGDNAVVLDGRDSGVSFRSVYDRNRDLIWTVIGNTTEGAWPVADALEEALRPRDESNRSSSEGAP